MYWYIIPYVYTHTWITPDYTALSLEEWLSDGSVYPNTCSISWYPSHSACEAGLYGTCVVYSRMLQLLQSCLTFRDPMDYSPPASSVHGILQARILEWVAMPSSRGSSQPREDQTQVSSVSCIAGGFFTTEPPRKPYGTYFLLNSMRIWGEFHNPYWSVTNSGLGISGLKNQPVNIGIGWLWSLGSPNKRFLLTHSFSEKHPFITALP